MKTRRTLAALMLASCLTLTGCTKGIGYYLDIQPKKNGYVFILTYNKAILGKWEVSW